MKVAVIGLGRIGMPLAVQYADHVDRVIGVDIDPAVVDAVNAGRAPFEGEPDLQERLAVLVRNGALSARQSATTAAAEADVVVVVVPLVVGTGGAPDFTSIDEATAAVGRGLRPGALVAYETTVPVGTTRGRFVPSLEAGSGLRSGSDFHVVFSPERVLTGRVFADLRRYPKLVGGMDVQGERRGVAFYERVLEFDDRPDLPRANGVWAMGSAEAAEMAKLVETTYRDVNIALANEFALYAQGLGVDFGRVVDACNSQPYSHVHRPGIAVGGHCIPVYPHLYLANDPDAAVVRTSRAANEALPDRWLGVLEGVTGPLAEKQVAVLGAGFRGDVRETAFSGIHPIVRILLQKGAEVRVHDPLQSDDDLRAMGFEPFHRGMSADVVVVQADHSEYRTWSAQDVPGVRAVLDGRGILDPVQWAGVPVVSVLGRLDTQ